MGRRKTQEEWNAEVISLTQNEYTFLERYINTSTKIRVRHNTCGHEYLVQPNVFSNGRRCPKCALSNRDQPRGKLNPPEWVNRVRSLVGTEYSFLEGYLGAKTKLRVRHNLCGSEYYIAPSDFSRGSRCSSCARKQGTSKHTKSQDEFDAEVLALHGNAYTFLEPYVNTYTTLSVRHNVCGRVYKVAPRDFVKGAQCSACVFKEKTKSQGQWDKEVWELERDKYTFLEDYMGDATKIKVRHNACGNQYKVKPNSFLNGNRCPRCKESTGEKLIAEYLLSNSIRYTPQKGFEDLRDKAKLLYDFYVPGYNLLIEYQGQQHYYPIEFFGGVSSFEIRKAHDNMKKAYATNNGYRLLEIHYSVNTEDMIKQLLDSELKVKL